MMEKENIPCCPECGSTDLEKDGDGWRCNACSNAFGHEWEDKQT